RERTALERDGGGAIHLLLFGFARNQVTSDEQELAPEQPHAVASGGERGGDSRQTTDVRHYRDVFGCLRHGGRAGPRSCGPFDLLLLGAPPPPPGARPRGA